MNLGESKLKNYITKDQPFGPISSTEIKEMKVMQHLFDKQNLIYEALDSHPSIIIGRRGAGKTAFLRCIHLDGNYDIILELATHKAFREIIDSIGNISKDIVFPEEVAELWDLAFWHTILVKLINTDQDSHQIKKIERYLSGIELLDIKNPFNVIRKLLKRLENIEGGRTYSVISEFIDEMIFNDVTFNQARDEAKNYLEYNNMRAIILLDTLEDLKIDDQKMVHALAGLLKCQGEFHKPGSPCELRVCLPSEMYHKFKELSSNPIKDFQHSMIIHWHASELVRLVTHRYNNFLKLYYPSYQKHYEHLNLEKRTDALDFLQSIFPPVIENRYKIVERPIAYILRHTQLLPRHLLMYLNEISRKNLKNNNNPLHFSQNSILEGIFEIEHRICSEIFSAYKYVHPDAKKACERCIPSLPLKFTDGELHKIYNIRGKVLYSIFDYEDFKKMMIEIGAIGRVIKESDRYVEGLFEYSVPDHLNTSPDDELCLHPVFSVVYHSKKPEKSENAKVIYPYGTDVEMINNRELF